MDPTFLVIQAVAVFLMALTTMLVKLAALLVAAALMLNSTLVSLSPTGMNGFILQGWAMFRDLANLGFVLGIIIIAFATIFRFKSYSASQILWKLVVAALLVNFSLVIVSPFLVTSQNFSDYYLAKISGTDTNNMFAGAALKAVSTFNPLEYAQPSSNTLSSVAAAGVAGTALAGPLGGATAAAIAARSALADATANAVSAVIGAFLQIVVFMTLLGFAVVLLVRYFFVAFLMILSPIVWLLWIFPSTEKHWRTWWDEFIKWMIFPPVVLFFLDLSLVLYAATTNSAATSSWNTFVDQLKSKGGGFVAQVPFSVIMGSLMSVAMLIGGMMVASKIGVKGGNMATSAAGKAKDWTVNRGKEYGARGASKVGASALKSQTGQRIQGKLNQWGATPGGKMLGMGYLAQKQAQVTTTLEKKASVAMQRPQKRLDDMTNEQIINGWDTLDKHQQAVAMQRLQSAGLLPKLLEKKPGAMGNVNSSLSLLRGMGKDKDADGLAAGFASLEDTKLRHDAFNHMQDGKDRAAMIQQMGAEGVLKEALDTTAVNVGDLTRALNELRSNGQNGKADSILQSVADHQRIAGNKTNFAGLSARDQAVVVDLLSAKGKMGKMDPANRDFRILAAAANNMSARGKGKEVDDMLLANGLPRELLALIDSATGKILAGREAEFNQIFQKTMDGMSSSEKELFAKNVTDMVHKGQFSGVIDPVTGGQWAEVPKERLYSEAMESNAMVRTMMVAAAKGTTKDNVKKGLVDEHLKVLDKERAATEDALKKFEADLMARAGGVLTEAQTNQLEKKKADLEDLVAEHKKYKDMIATGVIADYDKALEAMRNKKGSSQEFARSVGKV